MKKFGLVLLFFIAIQYINAQSDLEVIGQTQTQTLKLIAGASNGYILVSDANGLTAWTHPDSVILSSGATYWRLVGNNLYNIQGSQVGIGTRQPLHTLNIADSANALFNSSTVDVSNIPVVVGKYSDEMNEGTGIGFQSDTNRSNIGAAIIHERTGIASEGKLHFATKTTNNTNADIPIHLTINDNGHVGIGVTSPNTNLEVAGGMRVDNGTFHVDHMDNRIGINTTNPGAELDVYGELRVNNGQFYVRTSPSRIGINTSQPQKALDVVGDVKIDDNTFNVISDENRIGIGTEDPSHTLNISDASNAMFNSSTVDISNLAMIIGKYSDNLNEGTGIGFQSATHRSNVGAAIIHERTGNTSKGKLHFATKTSISTDGDIPIHMTISDDGRVGIGTTDPEFQLTVANGLKVDGSTFNVRNGVNRVGIGTANPTATLEVAGDVKVDGSTFNVDESADRVDIGSFTQDAELRVRGRVNVVGLKSNRDFNIDYTAETDGFLVIRAENTLTADPNMPHPNPGNVVLIVNGAFASRNDIYPSHHTTVTMVIAKGETYRIIGQLGVVDDGSYFRPMGL